MEHNQKNFLQKFLMNGTELVSQKKFLTHGTQPVS